MAAHPSVNDDLPWCIMSGYVIIKPNVRRFTATGVIFEDGSMEDNIDMVMLATGYKMSYPFISHDILPINDNRVEMYKYVFNPEHKHPTMAVLGLVQPLGPILPIAELQARWATRIFKGKDQPTYHTWLLLRPPLERIWGRMRVVIIFVGKGCTSWAFVCLPIPDIGGIFYQIGRFR